MNKCRCKGKLEEIAETAILTRKTECKGTIQEKTSYHQCNRCENIYQRKSARLVLNGKIWYSKPEISQYAGLLTRQEIGENALACKGYIGLLDEGKILAKRTLLAKAVDKLLGGK